MFWANFFVGMAKENLRGLDEAARRLTDGFLLQVDEGGVRLRRPSEELSGQSLPAYRYAKPKKPKVTEELRDGKRVIREDANSFFSSDRPRFPRR